MLLPKWFPPPASCPDRADPVTLTQAAESFILANRFVTARVDRQSGDLVSLKYQDQELLGSGSGHPAGYWSHTPTRGPRTVSSVTIDPARNAGERAEVSVKGFYEGAALGQGPGGSVAGTGYAVTGTSATFFSMPARCRRGTMCSNSRFPQAGR